MKVLELLVGKRMIIKTDMNVDVELEIQEVKEEHHSEDLGPSTAANDWWPPTRDWKTYNVTFTNGAKKVFQSLNEINVIN